MTRDIRGGQTQRNHHVRPDIPIPANWKAFLQNGHNKSELISLYTTSLENNSNNILIEGQELYVSGGREEITIKCTKSRPSSAVVDLYSNQEESDTRIVLHAVYAAKHCNNLVICSPDTDVLVLLLHHRLSIPARNVFFMTGRTGKHADQTRFIPVHTLFEKLTPQQLAILMPVYCLTGCDTVSSFHGHGKRMAYRLVMQKSIYYQALSTLGENPFPSEREKLAATHFVGDLYGDSSCASLNKLRALKVSKKTISPKKLPPTDDSFAQHLLRTCLQLIIWKQATIGIQTLPDITECGYKEEDFKIVPIFSIQPPAAPELLSELICNCSRDECDGEGCYCFMNEQPCTSACGCDAWTDTSDVAGACGNPLTHLVYQDVTDDEDESD